MSTVICDATELLRRVTAALISFALLGITSCSRESSTESSEVPQTIRIGEEIEEDTPWYSTTRIVLPEPLTNSDMLALNDSVILTSLVTEDDLSNWHWQAECYDFDGNLCWQSIVGENLETPDSINDVSLLKVEDKVYIIATLSDTDIYYEINSVDGTVVTEGNSEVIPELGGRPREICDLGFVWFKNTLRCGDYTVSSCCSTEGPYLWTYSAGEYGILNINETLSSVRVDDIRSILPIGENKVLLVMVDMSSEVHTYVLNLDSMTLEPFDFKGELSEIDALELVWGGGDGLYTKHLDELYEVDLNAMTGSEIYSGSLCNCNLVELQNSSLISASEDDYVFYSENGAIYICSKANSNPNSGKKVLEAASVDGLSYEIAEAVYKFNRDNASYFILYNDEYESGLVDDEHEFNRDDELFYIAGADLSDKLVVDIMAGEGPDIILNSSEYLQLNNENCLIDLSQYVGELDSNIYFTNIIEASKKNGKIYQMPVSFTLSGLVVNRNVIGDVSGFTYSSYDSAVDNLCNGKDPLSVNNSRLQYMDELINSGFDRLINEEGTPDTEGEPFRQLIEYCAGADEISYNNWNLEQGIISEDGTDGYNLPINYRSIDNVTEYVNILEDCNNLCGLPADIARGPSATVVASIGISESCANPEAVWEFAVTLLDAEVQSNSEALPISKAALGELMDSAVEEHNEMVDRLGDLGGFSRLEPDYSAVCQDYLMGINSVTGCDTAMLMIVNEEVQAYFAGDKTLDEVFALIQNRCNLVTNER